MIEGETKFWLEVEGERDKQVAQQKRFTGFTPLSPGISGFCAGTRTALDQIQPGPQR